MKFCLFIVFSHFIAVHSYVVPEHLPRMYFDGTEWKQMRPERNSLSSERRSTLSLFLDMFPISTLKTPTIPDKSIDLDDLTATSQNLESIDLNLSIPSETGTLIEKVCYQKPKEVEETTTATITSEKKNVSNKKNITNLREYQIILFEPNNITEKQKSETKEATKNTTPITNPTEWLKLMLEFSKTFNGLIQNQMLQTNVSDDTEITKTSTTVTDSPHEDVPENRRTMEGIDDLLALFTDGIEIDNGSDSSDELNPSNRKFIKTITAPRSKERRKVHDDTSDDKIRDTDSADIVSDGIEDTRLVLVEDRSE